MDKRCECAYPYAVNSLDNRLHCDGCGHPVSAADRRHPYLRAVGIEIWSHHVYAIRGISLNPATAWRVVDNNLRPPSQRMPSMRFDPPPRGRIRYFMRMPILFETDDPE